MKKVVLLTTIFLIIGFSLGFWLAIGKSESSFENLNLEAMHQEVITKRDLAINKAVAEGEYRCCINPPCTMCFMEENKWNNQQAGTCACDDLIAEGKEPCPQCVRGLCHKDAEGVCLTNPENET